MFNKYLYSVSVFIFNNILLYYHTNEQENKYYHVSKPSMTNEKQLDDANDFGRLDNT